MTQAPQFLLTPQGRRIAYHRSTGGSGKAGIVFCGGFKSDMTGTKALYLEDWAKSEGRDFLRFDYSGHGQSEGVFEEGAVGDWFADALAAFDALTEGPQVVVGSSMGGWIALLIARARPERLAGLVGIAPAPDFTEDLVMARLDDAGRAAMLRDGRVEVASDYSDAPYVYTRRLLEDGRDHLVLRAPLDLPYPVRLLHGSADDSVPVAVSLKLIDHATCPDMRLTLFKDGDHRLSAPEHLAELSRAIAEISG